MKPYVLRGHSRPITQVLYNRDGDLIFTTSKDSVACIWFSSNGERLGTLGNDTKGTGLSKLPNQHMAAIWGVDVSRDSLQAITCAGDMTVKLWDVSRGTVKDTYHFDSTVRCTKFSLDANTFVCTQDKQSTADCKTWIVDTRLPNAHFDETDMDIKQDRKVDQKSKVLSWKLSTAMLMGTRCLYGFMDETVITGDENGVLKKFDIRNLEFDEQNVGIPQVQFKGHASNIKDMRLTDDRTMLLTTGKDKYARLWDCMDDDFEFLKEVKHTTQANSCAFNPQNSHIAVAGGQEAMNVTTTMAAQGNFETYIYNIISEEPICNFRGHFGPVNSLDFHPNGKQICTGGEEGYIRLNHLDQSYTEYRDIDMEMVNEQYQMGQTV